MNKLFFDTDVIIDYLRGYEEAIDYFEKLKKTPMLISTITIAELFSGARPTEQTVLENFIHLFEEITVDRKVAELGGQYRYRHMKSHGVGLADALIAASAELNHTTLVTLNKKHYPMLDKIIVPYEKHPRT